MINLDEKVRRLISEIQGGLPLVSRPFEEIAKRTGMKEAEVMERIQWLQQQGAIKRLGIVVRHHELGYRANAMVVWDVPDEQVAVLGQCFSQFEFITLCYQRPRRLPQWRYNLFCMIHGQDRKAVLENLEHMVESCGVQAIPKDILFSRRRFKQRGALYVHQGEKKQQQVAGG